MRTTFEVSTLIYGIINVAGVTGKIDGSVYKGKKPMNNETQDIVINTLPISNDDTQKVTVIINCYCINSIENGAPNNTKLKSIADAVITALNAYSKTKGKFFQFEIVSQNVMNDYDQKNMSYVAIRLNCYIENS